MLLRRRVPRERLIHPFGHHLKAGEVFLQSFQLAAVAAEDDARSGDHRSPNYVVLYGENCYGMNLL